MENTTVFLQLLRKMGAAQLPPDKQILALGLRSEDWEVQLTAVLIAARLGLKALYPTIRQVEIPQTSRSGLAADERRLMLLFKKAALALLAGTAVPPDSETKPTSRDELQAHILRCAAGAASQWRDAIWWWAHTLTTTLASPTPPASLPAGIVQENDGRYRLPLTEIEMVWVMPEMYWVGGPENPDHRLRLIVLERGFFIAKRPVTTNYSQPDIPISYPLSEAIALCDQLSAIENAPIRLSTATQWETAARGTDARRFPWGNGYQADMLGVSAPCGAELMVGICGQWVKYDGALIAVGADRKLAVYHRQHGVENGRFALRPVICN